MKIVRHTLCLITFMSFFLSFSFDRISGAANLKEQEKALNIILDFANKMCDEIPLEGESEGIELSGDAKAELHGLLKKLVNLGIAGASTYQKSDYQGVLQEDLAEILKDSRDCKLKIFNELKSIMLALPSNISTNEDEPKSVSQSPISPLNIFVDSSGAAAQATIKFVELLGNQSAKEKIESNIEKETLKGVIRSLVSIEYCQAPLPWLLRNYVFSEERDNWQQVTSVISHNTPIISELIDVLEDFDGNLIYRDINTYKKLRFMMNSRAGLYSQLANMEPPKTQIEAEQLLKIADNFEILIKQMKLIQIKLSEYLKNG